MEFAKSVLLSLEDLNAPADFLVSTNPLFDVIVGLPGLESFQGCIDLETQTVKIKHGENIAKLLLNFYVAKYTQILGETDIEDFTFDEEMKSLSAYLLISTLFHILKTYFLKNKSTLTPNFDH